MVCELKILHGLKKNGVKISCIQELLAKNSGTQP